jgi:hypothetical protein
MSNKKTTTAKPKNGKDVVKEVLSEEVVHELVTDNTPVVATTPSEPRVRTAEEIAASINASR